MASCPARVRLSPDFDVQCQLSAGHEDDQDHEFELEYEDQYVSIVWGEVADRQEAELDDAKISCWGPFRLVRGSNGWHLEVGEEGSDIYLSVQNISSSRKRS